MHGRHDVGWAPRFEACLERFELCFQRHRLFLSVATSRCPTMREFPRLEMVARAGISIRFDLSPVRCRMGGLRFADASQIGGEARLCGRPGTRRAVLTLDTAAPLAQSAPVRGTHQNDLTA